MPIFSYFFIFLCRFYQMIVSSSVFVASEALITGFIVLVIGSSLFFGQ